MLYMICILYHKCLKYLYKREIIIFVNIEEDGVLHRCWWVDSLDMHKHKEKYLNKVQYSCCMCVQEFEGIIIHTQKDPHLRQLWHVISVTQLSPSLPLVQPVVDYVYVPPAGVPHDSTPADGVVQPPGR